jgi:hypothetical protein
MNILALAKMARGGVDLDAMKEMLSGMGVNFELTPIPMEAAPATAELEAVAVKACENGAKFFRLTAHLKGGQNVLAFVVLPTS